MGEFPERKRTNRRFGKASCSFCSYLPSSSRFQAASLLAFIAIPLAFIPFVLYAYGPQIRSSSRFAEEIAEALELEKKMSDEDEAEAIMLARKVASQKKREERRAKKEKERMEWEKAETFNVQDVEKKDVKSQKVEQKKAKQVEKEKEEKSG